MQRCNSCGRRFEIADTQTDDNGDEQIETCPYCGSEDISDFAYPPPIEDPDA